MCENCTLYDSARTERGNTFTNGKLSFRVYGFNVDDDDYTLFYYVCEKGEWVLKYPITYKVRLVSDVRESNQRGVDGGIDEQLRNCRDWRLPFLLNRFV